MATCNFADPYLEEDSDQEVSAGNESDEETSGLADATSRQKLSKPPNISAQSLSSEDEFEKEMMSELESQMKSANPVGQQTSTNLSAKDKDEAEHEALFYDSKMDDEDERWVKNQRDSYRPKVKDTPGQASSKPPNSDAVLNCPACMCTVCLDCQRHSAYSTQYRAMFTLNTLVNYGETLQMKRKQERNIKNKRKRKLGADLAQSDSNVGGFGDMISVDPDTAAANETADYFHPVNCSNCNTRLAVYDSDEVYHFFNVISSYS